MDLMVKQAEMKQFRRNMARGIINWKTDCILEPLFRQVQRVVLCRLLFWEGQTSVCNSVAVNSSPDFSRWQGALPQCLTLLTVGFPVARWSQKHALPFEVLIGKADLIFAGALSSSLCGVLPRAGRNTRKHSLRWAFSLLSPSHI